MKVCNLLEVTPSRTRNSQFLTQAGLLNFKACILSQKLHPYERCMEQNFILVNYEEHPNPICVFKTCFSVKIYMLAFSSLNF